jgi:hypothetical protein
MLVTFIGAMMTAVLAACVAFIVQRWTGVNARWLIPASAGAAMLGFTLWNDYTWFSRLSADLPPEVVVVRTFQQSTAIQPWSLAVPITNRFQAVNRASLRRSEVNPDMVRAEVYLVARWTPTFTTLQVLDCAGARRADAVDSGPDGLPKPEAWVAVDRDDPLLAAACAQG